MLFKHRKGGNIVAEIVFAILPERRKGIDFERVLAKPLAGQRPRSQCASLKHYDAGAG